MIEDQTDSFRSADRTAPAATESPAISVAMSVYNGERHLTLAIQSVLDQTFTDFEFLILDDGSSDATPDIIRDFAARDPRIRPIIRENRGLIASLNQLLHEARAPIVARMDADDRCFPHRFERQLQYLTDNPDCGVVGSWSSDMDEDGNPMSCVGPEHPVDHSEFLVNMREGGPLFCHPAVMFRRQLVLEQGGYHAAFRHCEDLDLWLRLASVTRLHNIPERLLCYRHYPGQVSKRHATEQQVGAAIAYEAFRIRDKGLPDPTAHLKALPPIDELDTLFPEPGVTARVRRSVAGGILHSPSSLRDQGFDIMLRHIREGGSHKHMWRTVLRLVRLGEPARALKLFVALATT